MTTLSKHSDNRAVAVEIAKLAHNFNREAPEDLKWKIEQLLNQARPWRRRRHTTQIDGVKIEGPGGAAGEPSQKKCTS